jgi:NAD(P)H-nitrite reductase large subunit
MKKKYVIIGNSAAGLAAVNRLKELDHEAKIICISKELEKPYNKCRLTDYLSGKMPEQGVFLGENEYLPGNNFCLASENVQENGIEFIFGVKVDKIASDNSMVLLDNGKEISFDKLFIATGAKPVRLNIPGANDNGTFVFHTLQDTNNILKFIKDNKPKRAVIIGSGMTGMECASALHERKIEVDIIELSTHILPSCCDKIGAEFIESAIAKKISGFLDMTGQNCQENNKEKTGVNIYHNESVKEIISENGKLSCVVLNSGRFIATDMVVFSVGVSADIQLAKDAKIETGEFGIITNDFMHTNVANIYAGGDCAQVKDILTGKSIRSNAWHDATTQGQIAADNMYLSGFNQAVLPESSSFIESAFDSKPVESFPVKYIGALPTSYSDIFGINFASYLGAINHQLKYDFIFDVGPDFYNKIWLQDGFVKGFVLIGDISKIGKLKRSIISGKRREL